MKEIKEKSTMAKNGIPIYSLTNEHSHSFFISAFLRCGSMYESEEQNGISHFLEHIMIRNISEETDGKLYAILDKYGMEFNASTYSDMIQFYISGAAPSFRIAADLISMLLSPISLSSDEIEKERSRIKAEIRENDDKSSLQFFTAKEVWEDTSLSRPIAGTLGSVSRITKGRLEKYRSESFTKDNLFFYVTGNVSEEDISYLSKRLGERTLLEGEKRVNTAPVPSKFGKREGNVKLKNADFTKIRYTYDVDMSRVTSPELDLIYDILLGGYKSRFFVEMSEKRGLFYDIGGSVERYSNIAVFTFSYELREARLYEAAELTMQLIERYKNELLSPDECMKAGYVDNAYMLFDDTRELNFTFGYDNHILGLGYTSVEERKKTYASITPERLRTVAGIIFDKSNLTVTMKGDRRRIDLTRLNKILYG